MVSKNNHTEQEQRIRRLELEVQSFNEERKELRRINRMLKMLGECSGVLMRVRNETRLLKEICRIVVEIGGYRLARIDFSESEFATLTEDTDWNETRDAINEGAGVREWSISRGDTSSGDHGPCVSLPLIDCGEFFGTLNVCKAESAVFREDEAGSLKDLASNIACRLAALKMHSGKSRAEQALQAQLHFVQKLIDTIPSPIFYKDANGLYQGCNKTFEARLGLKREEIVGKSAHDLFPKHLAEAYHEMDMALLYEPGVQFHESTLLYADGTMHDVIINKATFDNVDGTLGGLVGVSVDITERKKAEKALRRAHDELELRVERRTAQLAAANEELRNEIAERKRVEEALRKSSERLKLFSYSVTHDLKSPTIGIYGLAKLLHKQYADVLDEKGKLYCRHILQASEQVAMLVDKINLFITTKETPLRIEAVSMKEVLQVVREEFSDALSLRRIAWSEPQDLPEVRADRLSLVRVFRNLVDNALKYGGQGLSEIRIGCEESESFFTLSLADNGVGIKPEDCEKVFGLFQRRETSKGVEGSGLGLAIVKEVAEHHHGKAWVEAASAGGTIFHFSISKTL